MLWFFTLLGAVSVWATAGGRRSLSAFWRDLPGFDLVPLGVCLAGIAAVLLVYYALFPRLMRRRMRAAMGPPGCRGPVPLRYRFDRAGLTQAEPGCTSFVPWPRIRGIDEDRHHLFLPTQIGAVPIVIAKATLGAETVEEVRRWARACADRPPLAPPPPRAVMAPDAVRAALRLTPEDRTAVILRSLNNPSARRARIVSALAWLAGLSLLYPALLAVLWAVDPYRVPLADTLPLFAEMAATDFWKPAAVAAALILLVLAAYPPIQRWFARDLARQLEGEAPPGEAEILFDDTGIVTAHDGAHAHLAWPLFRGRERAGDLLILPMTWDDVLPVPLRIFEPDARARLQALLDRHVPQETQAR